MTYLLLITIISFTEFLLWMSHQVKCIVLSHLSKSPRRQTIPKSTCHALALRSAQHCKSIIPQHKYFFLINISQIVNFPTSMVRSGRSDCLAQICHVPRPVPLNTMKYTSGSHLGVILPSPPGDIWQQNILLMVSSRYKSGMLKNILQCTGQPSTAENYPARNVDSVKTEKP